jgi:hypothetical protein
MGLVEHTPSASRRNPKVCPLCGKPGNPGDPQPTHYVCSLLAFLRIVLLLILAIFCICGVFWATTNWLLVVQWPLIGIPVMVAGVLATSVAIVNLLIAAFNESTTWFFGCLILFPFIGPVFVVYRWPNTKTIVYLFAGGLAAIWIGLCLAM